MYSTGHARHLTINLRIIPDWISTSGEGVSHTNVGIDSRRPTFFYAPIKLSGCLIYYAFCYYYSSLVVGVLCCCIYLLKIRRLLHDNWSARSGYIVVEINGVLTSSGSAILLASSE